MLGAAASGLNDIIQPRSSPVFIPQSPSEISWVVPLWASFRSVLDAKKTAQEATLAHLASVAVYVLSLASGTSKAVHHLQALLLPFAPCYVAYVCQLIGLGFRPGPRGLWLACDASANATSPQLQFVSLD